jgi:hypothetical protein
MRSSTFTSALLSDLRFHLVSTSDTIAVSFGFATVFIAIVAVFVTRRAYIVLCSFCPVSVIQSQFSLDCKLWVVIPFYSKTKLYVASTDLERRPRTQLQFGMQAHEDIVVEEMRLRRWSTVRSFESES